jgi:hypothetical protein
VAGSDAGVAVTCTGCGNQVLQKAMIPIANVTDGVTRVTYLCAACARRQVDVKPDRYETLAAEPAEEDPATV